MDLSCLNVSNVTCHGSTVMEIHFVYAKFEVACNLVLIQTESNLIKVSKHALFVSLKSGGNFKNLHSNFRKNFHDLDPREPCGNSSRHCHPSSVDNFYVPQKKRRIFESSINLGLGVGSGLVNSYYIYMGNRTEK